MFKEDSLMMESKMNRVFFMARSCRRVLMYLLYLDSIEMRLAIIY